MKAKRSLDPKKLVVTALLAGLAYVLNSFVHFPAMAPFQHFVDVIAAVLLGPWYGFASALICGILRMMSGRTIQAVTGAIFGPILGGLVYRKTHNLYLVFAAEVFGTGVIGALSSYPFMKYLYGVDLPHWYYFVPFYTPAAIVGAGMGLALLLVLQKAGVLQQMVHRINGQ
ncbi:energy coupling factor transporter S component ThiW [Fructobacillus ficulneus]|uniref:ThiW protein n=1 Tax=Fructobacillus ficulneus TaxID=157463 RepID=A0A0K8MIJ9_9LACO|nr:energy coupling factor transporter S component ThiW [Fructobacillus ficulneus]GAP00386.1 thiW protein [Fructobacillus ficulneus]